MSIKKKKNDLNVLLNSLSSPATLNILNLFKDDNKGFSLTETAKGLKLSLSTVQDNVKRLSDSKLIFFDLISPDSGIFLPALSVSIRTKSPLF